MAQCGDFIKSQFPLIDEELKKYVEGMVSVGYKKGILFVFFVVWLIRFLFCDFSDLRSFSNR